MKLFFHILLLSSAVACYSQTHPYKVGVIDSTCLFDSETKNTTLLSSYLKCANIENDTNITYHLDNYTRLSDSLMAKEQMVRNILASIQLETYALKQQKDRIVRQKLWATIFLLIFMCFLIFGIQRQQIRKKKLILLQQQQKSNEEIYNLLLAQQEKVNEGRLQERKRISEELHDGILSKLFGIRMSLDGLNHKNSLQAINIRRQYLEELRGIEGEIREVSHELNLNSPFFHQNYVDIVSNLLHTQSKLSHFYYEITGSENINWNNIPYDLRINIYRIIQEALQNIQKYAQAQTVKIRFRQSQGKLKVAVSDDGIGFNPREKTKGIGLKNMKSRAQAFDGRIIISSEIGHGTNILLTIPLPKKYLISQTRP